jgi:hypothetical protein
MVGSVLAAIGASTLLQLDWRRPAIFAIVIVAALAQPRRSGGA